MKFYVIWSDGRKFGPADIPTLAQWAAEGRVNRDTQVENAETGQTGRARDIQGLVWPTSAPMTDFGGGDPTLKAGEKPISTTRGPISPDQPQSYVAGKPLEPQDAPQQGSSQNPPQPASPYPRDAGYGRHMDDGSAKLINQAWILYVVGFLCCCICTPFGLYSANRAKNMGNPNANTPVIVGWILLGLQVVGVAIYGILFAVGALGAGGFPQ